MFEEFRDSFPDLWERQQRAKRLREQQHKQDQFMYDMHLDLLDYAESGDIPFIKKQAEWVIEVYSRLEEEEDKVHSLEEEVEYLKECIYELRSRRY